MATSERILITGGASGLGRELARLYASRSDRVLVLDVDREAGAALAHDSIDFVPCDLAGFDVARPPADLARKLDDYGAFDVVILNAGISNSDPFLETSRATDDTIFAVNLIGHMQLLKLLLRREMIVRGGRLGLIASASEYLPFPIALAYAASKAAVSGLARALGPYLRGHEISVTAVYPGPIKTPHATRYYARFDEGRGADPARVARTVARGLRRRRRHVRPDPVSRIFYGLSRVVPGILDRIVYGKYREHLYAAANRTSVRKGGSSSDV